MPTPDKDLLIQGMLSAHQADLGGGSTEEVYQTSLHDAIKELRELFDSKPEGVDLFDSHVDAVVAAALRGVARRIDESTTPDEKIAAAKALLIAATVQRRRTYQAEVAAHRCACGHRRDQHTETASVNYTEGFCMRKGCQCRWFNFQPTSER